MGLFGGSDSDSSASQGSAATQTQSGDPLAVNLTAGKSIKNASVVIKQTDHGAIRSALSFADRSDQRGYDLLKKQLSQTAGVTGKILGTGERVASDVLDLSRDSLEFAADILDTAKDQGSVVADTVAGLTESFQGFVNRENNPGERVNLYLIVALTIGAVVVVGRK